MPEELFAIRPFALGGKGDFSRSDIRMAIAAIRRYGLSDDRRQKLLDWSFKILEESPDHKTKLLAIKMAVEMDKVDAKREENSIQQKHHEVLEATAVIRAAMQEPGMREQLAKISDHICKPLPAIEQAEIIEAQTQASQEVLDAMSKMNMPHLNGNGKH